MMKGTTRRNITAIYRVTGVIDEMVADDSPAR